MTTPDTDALVALLQDDAYCASFQSIGQYRKALTAALSAQQEPVAVVKESALLKWEGKPSKTVLFLDDSVPVGTKLYTAPPSGVREVNAEQPHVRVPVEILAELLSHYGCAIDMHICVAKHLPALQAMLRAEAERMEKGKG